MELLQRCQQSIAPLGVQLGQNGADVVTTALRLDESLSVPFNLPEEKARYRYFKTPASQHLGQLFLPERRA
jgi:hypothetical protein